MKMNHISSNRICSSLIPIIPVLGLLGGKNFHISTTKSVKSISVRYMTVQRLGIELAKQVDPVISGIDTITYGNINQTIFSSQRNSWLTAQLGKRIQPSPSAPPIITQCTLKDLVLGLEFFIIGLRLIRARIYERNDYESICGN